jgi:hypothetical protein
MRKILLLLTILLIFLSCKKENEKSDFIGNWSTISESNINIDVQFFKDSIVHHNPLVGRIESAKWKVIGNKIHQSFLNNNSPLEEKEVENILDYKFNLEKDTLFIKRESDSVYFGVFRKIKNSYEYFENKIGFEIKLEKESEELISAGNNDYNFNIYIGLKNNKIIAKTDYSNNLNELPSQLINFKSRISEKDEKFIKYALFIDNNIPNKTVDSIKSLFIKEIVKRTFIVKNYKENKWNEPISWLGNYEN